MEPIHFAQGRGEHSPQAEKNNNNSFTVHVLLTVSSLLALLAFNWNMREEEPVALRTYSRHR